MLGGIALIIFINIMVRLCFCKKSVHPANSNGVHQPANTRDQTSSNFISENYDPPPYELALNYPPVTPVPNHQEQDSKV